MAVGGNYRVFASHDFGSWSLEDVEKIGVAIKGSCDFSPGFFLGWQHTKLKAPFTSLRIVIIIELQIYLHDLCIPSMITILGGIF